jgi:hypothetical protein
MDNETVILLNLNLLIVDGWMDGTDGSKTYPKIEFRPNLSP